MAKKKAAETTHHSSEAKDSLNQKLEEVCTLRKEAVKLRRQLSDKAKKLQEAGAAMEDEVTLKLLDLNAAEIELAKAEVELLKYRSNG